MRIIRRAMTALLLCCSVAIVCHESGIFCGINRLLGAIMIIVSIGLFLLFIFTQIITHELRPLRRLAKDADHNQFQKQRAFDVTGQTPNAPQQLIEDMTQAQFVGDAGQGDDQTMLARQYKHHQPNIRYQRSITLPNDVQTIPQLAEFIDTVCEAAGFDMELCMKMNLAIEEAVVNVMNYAYPKGVKGMVSIDATISGVGLKFVISDNGTPFDPTAKSEVDTTLPAEERGIGGLGIHLIRQIMDSINYEYIDGRNVLTLIKKL